MSHCHREKSDGNTFSPRIEIFSLISIKLHLLYLSLTVSNPFPSLSLASASASVTVQLHYICLIRRKYCQSITVNPSYDKFYIFRRIITSNKNPFGASGHYHHRAFIWGLVLFSLIFCSWRC